jgi:hypothetical protein
MGAHFLDLQRADIYSFRSKRFIHLGQKPCFVQNRLPLKTGLSLYETTIQAKS